MDVNVDGLVKKYADFGPRPFSATPHAFGFRQQPSFSSLSRYFNSIRIENMISAEKDSERDGKHASAGGVNQSGDIALMVDELQKYTITMLVENEPGVTARVAGMFAGRGYNIETICGAPTANPEMSRITITTNSTPEQVEQIFKNLRRLVNVIKVRDMTGEKAVQREMALICVKALPGDRAEIFGAVKSFGGKIVDTGITHYIIEVTGSQEKIDSLIRLLEPMGIEKLARSGILGLYREPE
jgi:acetolactate synthase I/III small subunit